MLRCNIRVNSLSSFSPSRLNTRPLSGSFFVVTRNSEKPQRAANRRSAAEALLVTGVPCVVMVAVAASVLIVPPLAMSHAMLMSKPVPMSVMVMRSLNLAAH